MPKVSNIISSYVVSIYNGQIEGIVLNILFDKKKKARYLIISQNDEQFLILNTNDIYKLGDGAVLIKNDTVLTLMETQELAIKNCFSPINSIIVDIDGNMLGNVADIELDNRYNIVEFITTKNETINLKNVLNISDTVIIHNNTQKKHKLSHFRHMDKIKIPTKNIDKNTVKIMDKNETILPNRTVINYNFLIQRKVTKNITNFNGEIIIKENQIINSKILDIARINGKIRELTKFSV
ncbi:MAG: hypothetical protein IKB42_01880 [Clostridia bacterium]|nr:hypothetical protein [Clostridia bacterium]